MQRETPPAGAGDLGALRAANQGRVIAALREHRALSRADIARVTGLSPSTVSSLVKDLVDGGLVAPGTATGRGPGHDPERGRGRPGAVLTLAAPRGAVLGVDFGHGHIRVAVASLAGDVLDERAVTLDVDSAAATALDTARDLVSAALATVDVPVQDVRSVVLGVPAPVSPETGALQSNSILPGWTGLLPGEELSRRVGLPVRVENDANLGAVGEMRYGAGQGYADLVFVKLSTGIGAGLVLDGRLRRGTRGIAGEIGHVQVREDGDICRCGSRGCLETVVGVGGLLRSLQATRWELQTVEDLLALVARRDPGALRLLDDAGRAVGRTLGDLCNLLEPQAVLLSGELSQAGEPLLQSVRQAIFRYAQPGITSDLVVALGELGDRAAVLGAVGLALDASPPPAAVLRGRAG
ncbi:ROK family transcriptional regulator [Motilibacter deserti]|uniref:ROK family transcriptional regulator n=1 Tax=Motilibacter deserti TaxID=2714956 RepID=A0ABX0GUT1_9ACTN|nr:ROK family transcriptional regulator [Motilibacter deserti]